MRVVITGAAGRIGRQMLEELSDTHDLRLIDRAPLPGKECVVADLAKDQTRTSRRRWWRSDDTPWMNSFEGADVVLHLAADARSDASWDSVLRDNIQATWNILEIAERHHVPRVVFASSNWAVKALEQTLAPSCYRLDGPKIGSDAPPQPLRPYGISKALGEVAGQMFVDQRQLSSFMAVRIGAYAPEPHELDESLRPIWIGARDLRSLLRRCVEAPSEGFNVVYGVSAQWDVPYDLSYTRRLLSWEPEQIP